MILPAAKSGILAGIVLGIGRHRGNHGGDHGGWQSAAYAGGALERRAYHDCEHCNGDGLCIRPSQREPDRNGRGAFRLYSDHKSQSFSAEQEGRNMQTDTIAVMEPTKAMKKEIPFLLEKNEILQAPSGLRTSGASDCHRRRADLCHAGLSHCVHSGKRDSLPERGSVQSYLHFRERVTGTVFDQYLYHDGRVSSDCGASGHFAAIYLVEYAKKGSRFVKLIRITAETLSGIPSIVYGLFGMLFFVVALKWGMSLLSGAFSMVIMVLPLIMRTAEEALKSVPDSYLEASFGLGAGKLRTIFTIVLPSAVPGILAGVILAIGRVVGETAALIYTAGTVAAVPDSLMGSGRTLALHMYVLSSEGLHMNQASATAVVILAFVLLINGLSGMIAKRIAKG